MRFLADLHIHSSFSIATAKNITPELLEYYACLKGIYLLGTGDCIHPGWAQMLKERLEPAENGFFKVKKEYSLKNELPVNLQREVRFILTTEISSIYKKNNKTRKVHSLLFFPGFKESEMLARKLEEIGNIRSDGRPILGLDARKLLIMAKQISNDIEYIPAHIWTPHFSVLGSKSGFDSLIECFEDDICDIYALETGLSSDPEMNWSLSMLDSYTLISNSDAHSPEKIAREANIFDIDFPDYNSIIQAIRTKNGIKGTVEFYPEQGKYHLDGHRKCGVRLTPKETEKLNGICPVCGKKLTIGVNNRVFQLSDRKNGEKPSDVLPFYSSVPLKDLLSLLYKCGPATKKVNKIYDSLIFGLGPEYEILLDHNIDEISTFDKELSRGINNMRRGKVLKEAGFDGEFGKIYVF